MTTYEQAYQQAEEAYTLACQILDTQPKTEQAWANFRQATKIYTLAWEAHYRSGLMDWLCGKLKHIGQTVQWDG